MWVRIGAVVGSLPVVFVESGLTSCRFCRTADAERVVADVDMLGGLCMSSSRPVLHFSFCITQR